MLMVKAKGSVDNLSSYLEEFELLTQNSPFLMAAAIQDFLGAIYSWISLTQHQSRDLHAILCDRPSELLASLDKSVESVETMANEVEKARIEINQYVPSQRGTPKPFAESQHPAKSLAAASIESLKECVADGLVESKYATAINDTTELISKCFGIEDRDSAGKRNLLDVFTNHEKQRAEGLNSHSMKIPDLLAAIKYYTEALQLDPENPKILYNRSIAYSKVEASRVIEEILSSCIISKGCSVFVNSTPRNTIEIPSEPSYLFGLSKVFRKIGAELSKEKHFDEALECFYSAVSALEGINPPIRSLILESVESRSSVLETHIKTANHNILERFVSDTYTLATVPKHERLELDDLEIKKLQGCMVGGW
jgi:tetratricopeptide (TPR) repeat protein